MKFIVYNMLFNNNPDASILSKILIQQYTYDMMTVKFVTIFFFFINFYKYRSSCFRHRTQYYLILFAIRLPTDIILRRIM